MKQNVKRNVKQNVKKNVKQNAKQNVKHRKSDGKPKWKSKWKWKWELNLKWNPESKWKTQYKLLLLVNVILVVSYIGVSLSANNGIKDLYSQQEARRWETEKNTYAQVSAFISPEKAMQTEDMKNIRSLLMETLSQDSLNKAETNGRVWIDAYSGEVKSEIRKDSTTLSVTAMGVGGDFFQFHPLPLLSGSYISDNDVNQDRIVIDEGLAWALFGSNNIVGMQVWMGDSIYWIAGVVAEQEDSLTKIAYGSGNRIYMPYDQLKKHQEELKVTCYEAVLPNPITNYACNTLKSAFGVQEEVESEGDKERNYLNFEDVEVVENSNRYETIPMLKNMGRLKYRSMRTNSIEYPYWENVARVVEEQQMHLLLTRILLLLVPSVSVIGSLYYLWVHKTWTVKSVAVWISEEIKTRCKEKSGLRVRKRVGVGKSRMN